MMRMPVLALLIAFSAACGGGVSKPDTGTDIDAGADAATGTDADTGADPYVGTDTDASPDADQGTDTGPDLDAGADADGDPDAGPYQDAGADADGGADADQEGDAGGDMDPELPRGLGWVRENPMFISALCVQMGSPPAGVVNEYFDDFHANAVHLWENGIPTEMDGWAAAGHPKFRFLSWLNKNGTSLDGGQVAGGYPPGKPGLIGYQIGDEPGTWEHYQEIVAGLATVRAYDPDALLVVNFTYQLGDRLEEALDHFGTQTDGDVYSYDCYTWNNGTYEHLARYRNAGLRHRRPYWRYLYAYRQEPGDPINESDLRWEAFVGLTFGFTGHTWFVYQVATAHGLAPALYEYAGDYTAPKTELWSAVAQINRELAVLGRAITQLTSTDVRYVPTLDIYWPVWIDKWEPGAGGDPYMTGLEKAPGVVGLEILAGFFTDDSGEIYVMIQNSRHEHADFPINSSLPGKIHVGFDFGGAPPDLDRTRVLSLNKLTGQVEEVPLTGSSGDVGYLDVTLAAGDVFFFKYLDGRPFALQR